MRCKIILAGYNDMTAIIVMTRIIKKFQLNNNVKKILRSRQLLRIEKPDLTLYDNISLDKSITPISRD